MLPVRSQFDFEADHQGPGWAFPVGQAGQPDRVRTVEQAPSVDSRRCSLPLHAQTRGQVRRPKQQVARSERRKVVTV